jgi:hypothetical protein
MEALPVAEMISASMYSACILFFVGIIGFALGDCYRSRKVAALERP